MLIIPSPTKLRRDIVTLQSVLPSVRHILVNTRINILQWILTKLGTYLVLKRILNPIDFQGQRSRVKLLPHNILVNTLESTPFNGFLGFQILLRTKHVPSLVKIHWRMLILECSQVCNTVKNLPSDLDLWPMTLKINWVIDPPKD
jgi:hypothetical protein